MTDQRDGPEAIPTAAPPTPPPSNFTASGPLSSGSAPTPPPPSPRYQQDPPGRRRRVRTVAGVVIAVLVIGMKLGLAFGAGHLIRSGSGLVAIIVVVAVLLLGFLSRFMRL